MAYQRQQGVGRAGHPCCWVASSWGTHGAGAVTLCWLDMGETVTPPGSRATLLVPLALSGWEDGYEHNTSCTSHDLLQGHTTMLWVRWPVLLGLASYRSPTHMRPWTLPRTSMVFTVLGIRAVARHMGAIAWATQGVRRAWQAGREWGHKACNTHGTLVTSTSGRTHGGGAEAKEYWA